MGAAESTSTAYENSREKPIENVSATLYYFAGRGKADQIRWLLAASEITFAQKVITSREQFLKMAERQLPFGQLPLLQIDGLELVQSQAIVRYIARRGNLCGNNSRDEVKCDMIAETCNDILSQALQAPFRKNDGKEQAETHLKAMRVHWEKFGSRLEAVIAANGGAFMVGNELTYADILVAHCLTWFVEEVTTL